VALGEPGLSYRYVKTYGVSEEAYPGDVAHLNHPNALYIDGTGNVYVIEEAGSRLLKYSPSGANLWTIGLAGQHRNEEYLFAWPADVTADAAGNIWVADRNRTMQFDANGNHLQTFPVSENKWWYCKSDNEHFCRPVGIAFDGAARMYVSDTPNHRVQVFDMSSGSPVYNTTIGVTGEPGNNSLHFNQPGQVGLDSTGRLYVVDMANQRVQRCTFSAGWTCATFHGTGSEGSGPDELRWAYGLGIDASDNIYIADWGNGRVKKCTTAGTCEIFVTGLPGPSDVSVGPDGSVFVADWNDFTVRKYSSSGAPSGIYAGTSGVPYVPDATRINTPDGVASTSDGGVIVVENGGYRVMKFDASGALVWTLGQAGVPGSDNAHFGSWWSGPAGNPAIDGMGRVYVSDTGNDRIQILSASGAYLSTFGSWGTGPYQFWCPSGLAINPTNGDIFVTDRCNQRIQVFTKDRIYKATLGVLDEPGNDNAHFSNPYGVAVDANGRVYVADEANQRVQRCTLSGTSYTCTTFAGVTGEWGDDFDHLCPRSVAVDNVGHVYVTDGDNHRVQVFDDSGAYLTTIGGPWGTKPGEMRGPYGVAVDSMGNVYAADNENHRVQKYAPGVPGGRQVNINGFGDRYNEAVSYSAVFGSYLYAATMNHATGGEMWRSANGTSWTQVNLDGFGTAANWVAQVSGTAAGYLYVGTGNSDTGGEIWRCGTCDGADWTRVVSNGLGDANNQVVQRVVSFDNAVYATVDNNVTGVEVWRSLTGDPGTWTQCNTDGFGDNRNKGLWAMAVFNGYLYVATAQWGEAVTGVEVWRTSNGTTWNQVNIDGFGDPANSNPWLEPFGGQLYLSSGNGNTGVQIRRCAICDGADWSPVVTDGFGDVHNGNIDQMLGFGNRLYAATGNSDTGTEIWSTADGVHWSQVSIDGFGDSNNQSMWGSAVFSGRLFLGTLNYANGGEVWMKLVPGYLPLALR